MGSRTTAHTGSSCIKVGPRPRACDFLPDSSRAYCTSENGGTVAVVDTKNHRVIKTIKITGEGAKPMGVGISPDGKKLYTANGPSGDVSVIDTASMGVVKTIKAGKGPWGVAVN